jgi:hypothetical protein
VRYDGRGEPPDGSGRSIEVTGHATAGDVTLSDAEWRTAHRVRAQCFIHAVDNALDNSSLWVIHDPVGTGIQPDATVAEYYSSREQLHAAAEAAEE